MGPTFIEFCHLENIIMFVKKQRPFLRITLSKKTSRISTRMQKSRKNTTENISAEIAYHEYVRTYVRSGLCSCSFTNKVYV